MKKYVIGAIAGLMISFGVSAHAEVNNLMNQVVQGMFPVSVDGKPLGDAIVVDNKTYLPVREFGEAVGYTVTFTEDRNVVLNKNTVNQTQTPTNVSPNPKYERYKQINKEISRLINEQLKLEDQINVIKTTHATMNQNVDDLERQVSEKQDQIDKLAAEKKILEEDMFNNQP